MAGIGLVSILVLIKYRTRVLSLRAQQLELQVEKRTQQLALKSQQLEKELYKRTEFTRALIHELKTPLTPLLSSSEYLLNSYNDEITLGFVNNIRKGTLNLEKRINELLDLARGEVGLIKLNREYLYPIHIIKDCITYFLPETQKKKQELIVDLPDILPVIYADEQRLRQIIFNLLSNASKFTRRNGEIDLKAEVENDEIIIEIQDTGCGIDDSDQKYLFEPYQRSKNTESGLGLGLYLSKMFVELHGGRIWMSSCKGKGSTFTFSIPIDNNDNDGG
jgi:signal transduction histidine kinase